MIRGSHPQIKTASPTGSDYSEDSEHKVKWTRGLRTMQGLTEALIISVHV